MVAPTKRSNEAWRSTRLFENGLGYVVVARFKASGEVEAGVFLVDTYCLGVKNAFFTRLWADEYEDRLLDETLAEGKTPLSAACGRKLVEDAVAYARKLGIEPHPDYKKGARVFGGIDPMECSEEFVFGKDGKPFYFQGPNDSEAFVNRVLATLTRRVGTTGFDYVLALGRPLGDENEDQDEDEDDPGVKGGDKDENGKGEPPAAPAKG